LFIIPVLEVVETLTVIIMEVPLCPLLHIKIQHSNWELVDLLTIEEHIATETNCQHPQLNTWVLSEPVKAFSWLVLKGSQEGSTPLLMACDKGNFDSVKHIVENWGVNINATASFYFFYKGVLPMKVLGASPPFVAAYRGHYNIVRYLVGRGADVSATTSMDSSYHMGGLIPLQGSVEPYQIPDGSYSDSKDTDDVQVRFQESSTRRIPRLE